MLVLFLSFWLPIGCQLRLAFLYSRLGCNCGFWLPLYLKGIFEQGVRSYWLPESEWGALVSAHRSLPIWMANAICAQSSCTCTHPVKLG